MMNPEVSLRKYIEQRAAAIQAKQRQISCGTAQKLSKQNPVNGTTPDVVDNLQVAKKGTQDSFLSQNDSHPQTYLEKALKNQGLSNLPNQMKEIWIDGDYKYTVRVHAGNSSYTDSSSIYRVSRQSTTFGSNGRGTGFEYLGTDGNWYHESVLKQFNRGGTLNSSFSEEAARLTHIPLGGKQ